MNVQCCTHPQIVCIFKACIMFSGCMNSQSVMTWIKMSSVEFLLWLSRLRTQHSAHEVVGSIPGLTQCVKDPALPQGTAQVADVAWMWCCCGCGVGRQLQLSFDPSLVTCICHGCGPKKINTQTNKSHL